jgi:hypothetical protein
MSSNKYKFNPETLEFEYKGVSKKKKFLLSGLSVFIGVYLFFYSFLLSSHLYSKRKINELLKMNILYYMISI